MTRHTDYSRALRDIVKIVAPKATSDARRAMADKLAKSGNGKEIGNLAFSYENIGQLFHPDNPAAAAEMAQKVRAARESGDLQSVIPMNEGGILATDLLTWPDCPPVLQSNPLSYWLPASESQPAPSGAPESDTPPPFRPRIGWQIALFDAWPAICKTHGGRHPTAAEAVRYLQANDDSGQILQKTDGGSLWWKPQRGKPKEVTLKTVENTISDWRTRGALPA